MKMSINQAVFPLQYIIIIIIIIHNSSSILFLPIVRISINILNLGLSSFLLLQMKYDTATHEQQHHTHCQVHRQNYHKNIAANTNTSLTVINPNILCSIIACHNCLSKFMTKAKVALQNIHDRNILTYFIALV